MASRVTAERLRELLEYDPATGVFKWRPALKMRRNGLVAGSSSGRGYWYISIDKRMYLAHRLAWLYVHGCWPIDQIDHINRVKIDNRIVNLREATGSQNKQNVGAKKSNRSGLKGIWWDGRIKRWRPRIRVGGRALWLGSFRTPEEAHAVYCEAARKHFGEYARFA